jgi:uncharacterized protein YndB with AHSA1/START domain
MPATPKPPTSDAAVQSKTGKTWDEWFALLDSAGAAGKSHKEIVNILNDQHPEIGGWWMQSVTVAYERARGLRQVHQTPAGFEASATRTIAAPVARAYKAFADTRARNRWLHAPGLSLRGATPEKTVRFTWPDDNSHVTVRITPKGEGKSNVAIQHTKLRNATAVKRQKAFWSNALDALQERLEA